MKEKVLKNFLNVYWLRPETAMWRTIDACLLNKYRDYIKSPSLDFGCGDGIFSFIAAQGGIDLQYDVFKSTTNLESFFNKIDIYNSYDEKIKNLIKINRKPNYVFDTGFDHKQSLLDKANLLSIYKSTTLGDGNGILAFENESFSFIFSNIIYWLNDPEVTLREIKRILKKEGKAFIFVPDKQFAESSFYYNLYLKTKDPSWKWLEKIDRGRLSDNIQHTYSYQKWAEIIQKANLNIIEHKAYLSEKIIKMWDIGLRPISPLLIKMTSKINNEDLLEIKEEWINLFYELINPIIDNIELNEQNQGNCTFHMFILEK
ncbi:MAG TPA: methyltransferase domain-containing protein [Candidatus Gastranaerophilales bacterium]|nr:methyltransferase domain-containing protein [Candidatus Gastranaerophilales bacterium]